jgi:formate dehydrogenase alpha subunit
MNYRSVLTTCPYCGCGCRFFLQVVDGKLVGVQPCKSDEISQGRLCIKGYNAHAFVQNKDRLTDPLVARDGRFEKASWEDAVEKIASELKRVREKYGPDSIQVLTSAKCTNEENYLMQKFARVVIGTNNVDHCARLCHASSVVGLASTFGSGAMTNSSLEFEDAKCVFAIGSNTLESHPLIGTRIAKAKEKGAKLIVADPRRTALAELADIHIQHRPGTDIALVNGMIHLILAKGLAKKEFIDSRTENFEAMATSVKDYTPEKVERITGVSKEKLEKAAEMYASAPASSIAYAMGITQHTTGVGNVQSLANLAMVTGNIGKPFAGVNALRGQNNVQGACDMGALPNVFSGYQPVTDPKAVEKFEAAWNVDLLDKPGLTVTDAMNAAHEGKIKAMLVFGENPMISDPDINHVREALEKLEFMAVVDIFMTETARLADVVLPASSYAEKDGTFTATDRRVQRVRKAIEPVGDSKPDWQVVSLLARAFGSKGFEHTSPREVFEEAASLTPQYAGMSYDRLENETLCWPCPDKSSKGTPILHIGKFARGKGLFIPLGHIDPAELPDEKFDLMLTTGRVLFQFHTGTMTRRSPKLEREAPEPLVEINTADAASRGIRDGDLVRVSSRRGEIKLKALVGDRTAQGVVFIAFHYAEAAANVLTINALDPKAKIPEFKVCAVSVARA